MQSSESTDKKSIATASIQVLGKNLDRFLGKPGGCPNMGYFGTPYIGYIMTLLMGYSVSLNQHIMVLVTRIKHDPSIGIDIGDLNQHSTPSVGTHFKEWHSFKISRRGFL